MRLPENRMEKMALGRDPQHGAKTCPRCGTRGHVTHTWKGTGKQSPIKAITTRRIQCRKCQHVWHTREEKLL